MQSEAKGHGSSLQTHHILVEVGEEATKIVCMTDLIATAMAYVHGTHPQTKEIYQSNMNETARREKVDQSHMTSAAPKQAAGFTAPLVGLRTAVRVMQEAVSVPSSQTNPGPGPRAKWKQTDVPE